MVVWAVGSETVSALNFQFKGKVQGKIDQSNEVGCMHEADSLVI